MVRDSSVRIASPAVFNVNDVAVFNSTDMLLYRYEKDYTGVPPIDVETRMIAPVITVYGTTRLSK